VSFAAAEAAVNSAVISALWNARGDFGGADFPVIFDNGSGESAVGIVSNEPTAVVEDVQLAGVVANTSQLRIDAGVSYLVRGIRPDGTGLSTLILELA
jgi:hypothetical protein